ncbi:LIM domain and actin-binding protein 1 [Diaphorina citri]|uniref:LIM domain and actin-binding protein 1 n=1 Tax=Diaphorina citri TaxID=121845 RepID=A0A3Q0J699_DIACI|nr:LIM domain and actin-binding protein 1 [Diaphorina citri]
MTDVPRTLQNGGGSTADISGGANSPPPALCKSCGKNVFVMEQIKAEKQIWHKNCFRCHECNKQLTLDIYSSHEGVLYCKPHFRELFKPKAVVETPDPEPSSDKPDLGLEELSSLNVKNWTPSISKKSRSLFLELDANAAKTVVTTPPPHSASPRSPRFDEARRASKEILTDTSFIAR